MKSQMKRLLFVLAVAIFFMGGAIFSDTAAAQSPVTNTARVDSNSATTFDAREVEAYLDGLLEVEMIEKHLPGVVVVVVQDGRVLLEKGYGYANLEQRLPVDPDETLFRIGSVSKLFTWTAVMQLEEQGKVSLDRDINEYLDFAIPDTYDKAVTLRQLMTHTAGFEDQGMNTWGLAANQMMPLGDYLAANIPARVYPPGEVTAYSNYGAALAGYIVERVSGIPFEEYIEQNIFGPLEMAHSSFRQPLPDDLAANMASGYNYAGGQYIHGGFEYLFTVPGGAASATAGDMARFMIAHLQNGELDGQRILQEETASRMHSPAYMPDPRLDGLAYGFFLNTLNGQRILSHGGDTLSFHNGFYMFPDQNMGFFISSNGTGATNLDDMLIKAFVNHFFPAEQTAIPQTAEGFEERIKPYLGTYFPARRNYTSYEKTGLLFNSLSTSLGSDGTLVMTIPGQAQRFSEVEPGLMQAVGDPFKRIVYHTGPGGNQYLTVSSANFTDNFIKVPWYGSPGLHQLLFLGGGVLFLVAIIAWPIGYVSHRRNQQAGPQTNPGLARLARWTAALFGIILLASMLSFATLFMNIHPGFGVPQMYFGAPPILTVLLTTSYVIGALAVATTAFAAVAWLRRYWSVGGRIFYTSLALFALTLTWALAYWDLFL